MSKGESGKVNGFGCQSVHAEVKTCRIPSVSDFQTICLINNGRFGSIFKASDRTTIKIVAVKLYYKPEKLEVKRLVSDEAHQFIVNFYGFVKDIEGLIVGHVMEYMSGGSLHDVIHCSDKNYTCSQVFSWIFQTADALTFLHERGVAHGQISPYKLLLTADRQTLKINGALPLDFKRRSNYNYDAYRPPEEILFEAERPLSLTADVYALSVTVWEILARRRPYEAYEARSRFDMFTAIIDGERPSLDKVEKTFHSVLSWCWKKEANSRPTIIEFVEELKSVGQKVDLNAQIRTPEGERKGEAIDIFVPSRDGKRLVLKLDTLKEMLMRERLLKEKIALVSISGFNRTGKSTILNYLLAALAQQSCVNNKDFSFLPNIEKRRGFQCKKVLEKELKGVQIWSIPYFVEKDGVKLAVLLLDSSGLSLDSLFDSLLISAICSTFSAIRLFNCLNFLKKDDLYYVLIADKLSKTKPASQHTCFLIRNWPSGMDHEQRMLIEKLEEISMDSTVDSERMSCFFLVSKKENKRAFLSQVENLIQLIFDQLKPVRLGNVDLTGEIFLQKLQELVDKFHFPDSSQNLHQVYLQQVFQTALEKAEESFTDHLQACINSGKGVLNKDNLKSYFTKSAAAAKQVFEQNCKGFCSEEKKHYEQKLSDSFTEQYHTYRIHVEQLQSTERRLEKAVKSIENTRNQMEQALTGIKYREKPLDEFKSTGTSTDPQPSSSTVSETGSRKSTFSRSGLSRSSRRSNKNDKDYKGYFSTDSWHNILGVGFVGGMLLALAKWKGIFH